MGSRVQLYGGGCVTLITILVFGSTGAKIKYHGGGFIDYVLYYSSIIIGIFLIIGFLRLMKKKVALIFGVTGQDGSYLADLLLKKLSTMNAFLKDPEANNNVCQARSFVVLVLIV